MVTSAVECSDVRDERKRAAYEQVFKIVEPLIGSWPDERIEAIAQ